MPYNLQNLARSVAPGRFSGFLPRNVKTGGYSAAGSAQKKGNYRVQGFVGIFGTPPTPGRYKVRLIVQDTGEQVRTLWSDDAGNYDFQYVGPGPWLTLALDHHGNYRPVAADNVTTSLMP